ncbi:hypothetical protein BC828DRAFT_290040 [Blastocladiella britannica]|nr:hypothetical protein BC828DRAFT_290040 [Blastocladiella britannica]
MIIHMHRSALGPAGRLSATAKFFTASRPLVPLHHFHAKIRLLSSGNGNNNHSSDVLGSPSTSTAAANAAEAVVATAEHLAESVTASVRMLSVAAAASTAPPTETGPAKPQTATAVAAAAVVAKIRAAADLKDAISLPPGTPIPSTVHERVSFESPLAAAARTSATTTVPQPFSSSAVTTPVDDTQAAKVVVAAAVPPASLPVRWWRYVVALTKQAWSGAKVVRRNVVEIRALRASNPDVSTWTRAQYALAVQTDSDVRTLVPFLLSVMIVDELLPLLLFMGWIPVPCQTDEMIATHRARALAKRVKAVAFFGASPPLGYSPYTPLRAVSREPLQHMCRLFALSAIGPRSMLASRLQSHIDHLRIDDTKLRAEGGAAMLSDTELAVALEARAVASAHRDRTESVAILDEWLAMTVDRDTTPLQWIASRAVAVPWPDRHPDAAAMRSTAEKFAASTVTSAAAAAASRARGRPHLHHKHPKRGKDAMRIVGPTDD